MIRRIIFCVALTGWIVQPVFAERSAEEEQGSHLSKLLLELQVLQQEVLELRGLTEEQAYQLKQIKDTQRDHYLDLDRRLGGVQQKLRQISAGSGGDASTTLQRATDNSLAAKLSPKVPATAPLAATLPQPALASTADQSSADEKNKLEKQAYDRAYELVKGKKFKRAKNAFVKLLTDYPDGKFAPNAHYWMGELFMVESDLTGAADSFLKVVTLYPKHWKSADALYKLGEIYFRLDEPNKSKEFLNRAVSQFPDSRSARFASRYLRDNFPQ